MVRKLITAVVAFALTLLAAGTPAQASIAAPHWFVSIGSFPTVFSPGDSSGDDVMQVTATNVGGAPTDGGAVTLGVNLPAGLSVGTGGPSGHGADNSELPCSMGPPVTCSANEGVGPGQSVTMTIPVYVLTSATGVKVVADAAGGGAARASGEQSITIGSTPAGFGAQSFDNLLLNADGSEDMQAGSHPYQMTTVFELNTALGPEGAPLPSGNPKDISVALPPGMVGNPHATPQCSPQLFRTPVGTDTACPNNTVVGTAKIETGHGPDRGFNYYPVYNLVPAPGTPAEVGFSVLGRFPQFIDTTVRTGGDYGLTATDHNVSQSLVVYGVSLTIWGVPADPAHDALRGTCLEYNGSSNGSCPTNLPPEPFLTLPTSCNGPLSATFSSDSWQMPGVPVSLSTTSPVGMEGCNRLEFAPTISAAPDTARADTPAGLTVEIKPSLGGLTTPEGLSSADIQDTTVTLPKGVAINPGQAAGLQACGPGQNAEGVDGPPSCPEASRVGTVQITTPLLADKLEGSVYVLQSNPPDLQLLIAASADGVQVNLVGHVHLDAATGQLTTTFTGTPELPFSDFKLEFSGGAQAALSTPTECGVYTTTSDFTPWSAPFDADAFPSSGFVIEAGPGGSACAAPLPFAPELIAGATSDQAGGFTNFSMLLQRGDGQQRIERLQFKAPAGLGGMLSEVPLCSNAQAEANACPAASKIGHTVVESGPGPYPLVVPEPGQEVAPIYLTEAYGGAPFGLSIVVPLHVGPFTLPTQRVRAKIEIDAHTAQITVTTDALPQIISGVPTDLREVDAVIERPEFMFNPTNCNSSSFSGTAWGTPPAGSGGSGARAPISSPFKVGSCRSLEFAPKFAVSTPGHTSKADGAGLTAKVSYPSVPQGTQSDIAAVKVDLPKQLPSRLTTLQKACTNAQFEANPANCPEASKIGHAVVHTPELPVALEGPAIFVSHGGEAFPSLTFVLQGDNVTIDLVGTTNISKAGITSTTFKTVPDAPFSSFELTLGQGKYSALAANLPAKDKGSFCGQSLAMPTAFVAQNGAEIHESTKIAVTNCPKVKIAAQLRAQKLAAALRACRKEAKYKRAACASAVRRRYRPVRRR